MPGRDLLSLPNLVSLSRVAFAAAVLVARDAEARVALIGIASASDVLDGWLARRRHATTRLGALLDPLADRCFVLACVVAFVVDGALSRGQSLVLLARDAATAAGFLAARAIPSLRARRVEARALGKAVTALQLATLLAVLVAPRTVPWLLVLVGGVSVASITDYARAFWRGRAA